MKNLVTRIALAAVALGSLAASASAGTIHNPFIPDGTQYFNSRVIAGAAPNAYSTYIDGVRCSYEYRVKYGPYGPERIRLQVCN